MNPQSDGIEQREKEERRQRLYFEVPNPNAWFCLGQPETRGYRGVSLGATDNLFVSVKGQAFHQAKGSVQHVTLGSWYQSSTNDSVVNSGANNLYTARKQVIVVAGAGYAPDVQLDLGDNPPAGYFNPLDYQEILNPCRDGVRTYDTNLVAADIEFRSQLGYAKDPVAAAAAAAGRLERLKAFVLAGLFGTPVPPTANSESIEQFARQNGGLLGLVSLAKRYTDRAERWTSRPDTIPLAGPAIAKLNTLKQATNGLLKTYSQAEALFKKPPTDTVRKGGLGNDYNQEIAEVRTVATSALDAFAEGNAGEKVNAAVSFIALPRHLLRPLANQIRAVSSALQGLRNALDSLADMLNVKRKTAALALVGKEGVSLVSPRRVFGFAADGFHFISAKVGDPSGDWLDKGVAAMKKVTDLAGLGVVPLPDPVPGFTVRSAGDVVMSSDGRVTTSAMGEGARMQMMSQGVAEFGAVDCAALTARRGVTEVLGKKVVIGASPARVKAMAMKAAALRVPTELMGTAYGAVVTTREEYLRLVDERDTIRREARELGERILADPVSQAGALGPQWLARSTAAQAADVQVAAARVALRAAAATLQQATDMRDAIEGASDPAMLPEISKALGWKGEKQALADTVGLGGAKSVEVYSADTVELAAAKRIALVCESVPPMQSTKVSMGAEIEIEAGLAGLVKITVTGSGITIKTAGTEIVSTGTSIELTAGPSKITMRPDGIVLKGPTVTIDAPMITIA